MWFHIPRSAMCSSASSRRGHRIKHDNCHIHYSRQTLFFQNMLTKNRANINNEVVAFEECLAPNRHQYNATMLVGRWHPMSFGTRGVTADTYPWDCWSCCPRMQICVFLLFFCGGGGEKSFSAWLDSGLMLSQLWLYGHESRREHRGN